MFADSMIYYVDGISFTMECKYTQPKTPYRFTVRQKKREVAVTSGVAHFSDKICAKVVSILRVFW